MSVCWRRNGLEGGVDEGLDKQCSDALEELAPRPPGPPSLAVPEQSIAAQVAETVAVAAMANVPGRLAGLGAGSLAPDAGTLRLVSCPDPAVFVSNVHVPPLLSRLYLRSEVNNNGSN